jgi:hypothetical protein
MNLSRSGPSLSFGVRGAHVTVGPRGVRRTVGVPGTGLVDTSTNGHHRGVHSAPTFAKQPRPDRTTDLLDQLADLHRAGVLSDAGYAEKRATLLAPPSSA